MASLYRKGTKRVLVIGALLMLLAVVPLVYAVDPVEAPPGFDNQTNGYTEQLRFDKDRQFFFEQAETISDGLGPIYNARACVDCHQNPVSGSASQFSELRVGRYDGTTSSKGELINDRAIDPAIQEKPSDLDNVRTFRTSLNLLGDGFVEAIPDSAFDDILTAQSTDAPDLKGTIIKVPVLEASTSGTVVKRIGRFGWKNQHASLLSFSADAYLNEMGITSPLFPTENNSNGRSVELYDHVNDPEDLPTDDFPLGQDVEIFTRFIRSTKVPPRGIITANVRAGEDIFKGLRCQYCHWADITTAALDTPINGGKFTVPAALGGKIIHPYSDFMLHDVGTGDGIVQNGGQDTRNKMRTAPLWGLRTRTRLMHDGESLTINDAILRHGGQAAPSAHDYIDLTPDQKAQLLAFLGSL